MEFLFVVSVPYTLGNLDLWVLVLTARGPVSESWGKNEATSFSLGVQGDNPKGAVGKVGRGRGQGAGSLGA